MPSQTFKLDGDAAKYLQGRKSMTFTARNVADGVQLGCPEICLTPTFVSNGCKTTYTPNPLVGYKSVFTMDPLVLDLDYGIPGAVTWWTTTSFPQETGPYDPFVGSSLPLDGLTLFDPPILFFEVRGPNDSGSTCRLSSIVTDSGGPVTWSFADTDPDTTVLSWNATETWSRQTASSWSGSDNVSGQPRGHAVGFVANQTVAFVPVFSGGPAALATNRFSITVRYTYSEAELPASYWQTTEVHAATLSLSSSSLTVTHRNGTTLRGSWTMTNNGTVPASILVRRSKDA